jgi:hypothetical protein
MGIRSFAASPDCSSPRRDHGRNGVTIFSAHINWTSLYTVIQVINTFSPRFSTARSSIVEDRALLSIYGVTDGSPRSTDIFIQQKCVPLTFDTCSIEDITVTFTYHRDIMSRRTPQGMKMAGVCSNDFSRFLALLRSIFSSAFGNIMLSSHYEDVCFCDPTILLSKGSAV